MSFSHLRKLSFFKHRRVILCILLALVLTVAAVNKVIAASSTVGPGRFTLTCENAFDPSGRVGIVTWSINGITQNISRAQVVIFHRNGTPAQYDSGVRGNGRLRVISDRYSVRFPIEGVYRIESRNPQSFVTFTNTSALRIPVTGTNCIVNNGEPAR